MSDKCIVDKKLEDYTTQEKCIIFDSSYAKGGLRLTNKEPPFEEIKPPFSDNDKCHFFDNLYSMANLLRHNHYRRDI